MNIFCLDGGTRRFKNPWHFCINMHRPSGTGITPCKAQPTYRNENDSYPKH